MREERDEKLCSCEGKKGREDESTHLKRWGQLK